MSGQDCKVSLMQGDQTRGFRGLQYCLQIALSLMKQELSRIVISPKLPGNGGTGVRKAAAAWSVLANVLYRSCVLGPIALPLLGC